MAYIGWELPEADRANLLVLFDPVYPDVIAHHVTLKPGVALPFTGTLPSDISGNVVGYACDDGVQALVIEIGDTITRPDGAIYHITWSIDRAAGRKPYDSNKLLAAGWKKLPVSIPIHLEPKLFE